MIKKTELYLHHIKDSLAVIRMAQQKGKKAFLSDVFVRNTILHELQIVGEAARKLSDDYIQKNHSVPWQRIIGLRNQIVHYYHGIDLDTIWKIVENDLQILEDFIGKAL